MWRNCCGGNGGSCTCTHSEVAARVFTSASLFSNLATTMTISLTVSSNLVVSSLNHCWSSLACSFSSRSASYSSLRTLISSVYVSVIGSRASDGDCLTRDYAGEDLCCNGGLPLCKRSSILQIAYPRQSLTTKQLIWQTTSLSEQRKLATEKVKSIHTKGHTCLLGCGLAHGSISQNITHITI